MDPVNSGMGMCSAAAGKHMESRHDWHVSAQSVCLQTESVMQQSSFLEVKLYITLTTYAIL